MHTKEQILEKLKMERDKISPSKQVTDKWLEVKAERLFARQKEEDEIELDDVVKDTVEDIKDTQANINSVMAAEAKKKLDAEKTKKPAEKADVTPELPEEMKEMIEFYRAEKEAKQIAFKRNDLFALVSKGLEGKQKDAMKQIVDGLAINQDADVSILADSCKETYNKFTTLFADTNVTPSAAGGGKVGDLENEFSDLKPKED